MRRRGAVAIAGRPEASGSRTAQGLGAIRHRDVLDWGTGELREQNGRGSGREGHPPGIYGTMAAQAIVTRHGPLMLAQGGSGVCEGAQVSELKEEDEADCCDNFSVFQSREWQFVDDFCRGMGFEMRSGMRSPVRFH